MTNYIADQNPFNLVGPPEWFLRMMYRRDPDLVLFPGLSQPVYRLARKTSKSMGLMTALARDSESARMIKHRVVPVTSILSTVQWGPSVIQWLNDHDIWAVGGFAEADRRLHAQDEARLAAVQRAQDDEVMARSSSGYFALKQRAGQTVFLNSGA